MRISDWSSDVCSSDLQQCQQQRHVGPKKQVEEKKAGHRQHPRPRLRRQPWSSVRSEERRVGKECSVRVDLGGRRIIKKNTKNSQLNKMHPKEDEEHREM